MYLSPYSGVIDGDLRSGRVGLLITPQSHRPEQYDVEDFSYWAADNGCYTLGDRFDLDDYLEWLSSFTLEARESCLFATAPDVVGDWEATLERSTPVLPQLRAAGFPAALVLQDGATVETIPWDLVDAVFVGGSTEWKLSEAAGVILEAAAERGVWTHMGRVNSIKRSKLAAELGAYSVDGTLLVFGPDKNAPLIRKAIAQTYEIFGDVLVPADGNRYARLPFPAYETDDEATAAAYETPGQITRSLETGSIFEHAPHDGCDCLALRGTITSGRPLRTDSNPPLPRRRLRRPLQARRAGEGGPLVTTQPQPRDGHRLERPICVQTFPLAVVRSRCECGLVFTGRNRFEVKAAHRRHREKAVRS